MAKRIIHECDLTKQEFEPEEDQIFTLTIAKKGRKAPMKYEISASAAEKLLAQLNGHRELKDGWCLTSPGDMPIRPPGVRGQRTFEEDDSEFVAKKKSELREQGIIQQEEEDDRKLPIESKVLGTSTGNCIHMNKSRIQVIRDKDGQVTEAYRTCNDCNKRLAEMTVDAKKNYKNSKLPKDVNIRSID